MEHKKLFLMRHGEAQSFMSAPDFERKLTDNGIAGIYKSGAFFNNNNLALQEVFTSSAARTVQTCELFCELIHFPKSNIVYKDSLYNAQLQDILDVVGNLQEQSQNALIVGHNPTISYSAEYLCNESVQFSPGNLAIIEFPVESWQEVGQGLGTLLHFYQA